MSVTAAAPGAEVEAEVDTLTYLQAIRAALMQALDDDERVFLLGEDIGAYGGAFKLTEGLLERYGAARIIDTPISEAAIVGAAIGAAMEGMRPVAEMQFLDFMSCTFHLITNFAAKAHYRLGVPVPLVIRGPGGGGVGAGPFHSQCVEAYYTHTPGLKVVVPATPYDAKGLLLAAIADPNPVLYLEQKALYRSISGPVPRARYEVPLGSAQVTRRGNDLTIVTYGAMLHRCLDAIARLHEDGQAIDVELIDLRTLLPLDEATVLGSVRKTGKCLVVHEDTMTGGIGGEIAARIAEHAFEYLDGPVRRLASLDTPVPYAKTLERAFAPQADDIARAIIDLHRY
jgi:2-oxoisovalerate dehydrogenase E1 component beta subunit